MRGQPHTTNHIIIVHHRGPGGALVGIEGRPSGVGWVDIAKAGYDNRWRVSNAAQPKTVGERLAVTRAAVAALGVAYDWVAIASDAAACLGVPPESAPSWSDHPPDAVVCSSLANWAYFRAGLPHPGVPDRWVTPADWAVWIRAKGWVDSLT